MHTPNQSKYHKLSMEHLNRKSVDDFKQADKMPIILVLDNIRSMHNVGSIFRTADSFLVKEICLTGFTPQPPHRDIQKTALGATETVTWTYEQDITQLLQQFQQQGYHIIAVEQVEQSQALNNLTTVDFKTPIALILGNEVDGVSYEALQFCHQVVEIPQAGTKHSLNVSVAAGIVVWKYFEQFIHSNPSSL